MPRLRSLASSAFLVLAACSAPAPEVRSAPAPARDPASLAADDRIRIAEAFRLAESIGDELWVGWTAAPLAVLLVTPEREFLIRHPRPSSEFSRVGYDSLLRSEVHVRDRTLPPNLLATFPAVGGVPTIVVGQPRATGKSSTEWVLTLLHEHFHQVQSSRPDYYARVQALGLSRGEQPGNWMLTAASRYTPTEAFRALPDFVPFGAAADRIEAGIRTGLRAPLSRDRRVAFYPVGAAIALLLDGISTDWRTAYFDRAYSLDAHVE